MKKSFVFTLSAILLIFLMPAILSFGIRYIPFSSQPPLGATEQIFQDRISEQTFKLNGDRLTAIGVSFRNPNLRNKKDIILSVYSPDKKLVAGSRLNGNVIPDGGFVKFIFEPLTILRGEEVTISISAPEAIHGDSLELYLSKANGEIAFVDLYKPTGRLQLVKSIYKGWFDRFFADKTFAFAYLIFQISILSLLKIFWKKSSSKEAAGLSALGK